MGLLFDASAIFIGYKRGFEGFMRGQYTISLAAYELGNTVWKECFIHRTITPKQAEDIVDALSELLDLMIVIPINRPTKAIVSRALELGITYYDAAYVYVAEEKDLLFVTEDKKLYNAIKGRIRTNVLKLEEIKQKTPNSSHK